MDHITSVDLHKYVVSLDSLDMGLLPTYTARSEDTTSLWTANLSINNKDYFEFQIKSKTEAAIFDDDDSTINNESTNPLTENKSNPSTPRSICKEDTEITTCHICDIDLPAAYLDEHENSLKHSAYVKIADVVLNRTRQHMLKKNNGYIHKNNAKYFCGPCASEVKVDEKHLHDKSKAHRKSVSLDRLLFELTALYTGHEDEGDYAFNKTFGNTESSPYKITNESKENTVVISDIGARLEEFETKTHGNFIKVFDELRSDKPYALSSIGNDLKISMENGCEVIVSENNFNGFIQIDKTFVFCVVCKMTVEEKAHKISNYHMRNIEKPFKDHHCVRKLDNSLSHCIICNKIIDNTDFHVLCDKTHIELLQKALVIKENKPEGIQKNLVNNKSKVESVKTDHVIHNGLNIESDDNNQLLQSNTVTDTKRDMTTISDSFTKINNETYLCNSCNLELHANTVETHKKGKKHAMNSKSILHYNMKQVVGSGDLLCRVCNINVADNVNEIAVHVRANDHVQKYTDLLANHNIIRQQGNFYCKPCNAVILKRNELYHLEKTDHKINLSSFNGLPTILGSTQNININKDNSATCMVAVNNIHGKTNLSANVIKPTINESTPTDVTVYYCDICNVKVPYTSYNIRTHNKGNKHKKNVLKIADNVPNSIVDNSSDSECLEVHSHMDATDNEKSLMCKVCKVVVPNIEDNINEHVNGKKHDASFKNIMDDNHIECVGEQYFCKDCKVNIKTRNIFKHINKKKHLALLGMVVKPETVKATESLNLQATASTKDNETNKNTFAVIKESIDALYLKFKHHFVESEDKKWLKCRICFDTDIPNAANNVASHAGNKTHMDQYKDLLSSNLIFEIEGRGYFCGICVCLVPLKGEVGHAKGMRHSGNFTNEISKTHCSLCYENSSINMSEHIISREHVNNLLRDQTLVLYCLFCKSLFCKDQTEQHASNCHKFAVKDKLCFCTECNPYLTSI